VLDDPRLQIVLNDGRNYLATTRETFDVVTADPIHPGRAERLPLHGRVLPERRPAPAAGRHRHPVVALYELTPKDLRSVVRTFAASFAHVMIWLTYFDAELVGSNSPIWIDEAALARRIAHPAVRKD